MTKQPLSPKVREAYLELRREYSAQISRYVDELVQEDSYGRIMWLTGVMQGIRDMRDEIEKRLGYYQEDYESKGWIVND